MHGVTDCLNCNASLPAGSRFCPQCGQTAHVHRLSLPHLAHDVVHYFTHADKGIFHLIRQLAVRPGIVARNYVWGKRKQYFSPLNFFLIVIGLFVFVQTTFRPMNAVNMDEAKAEVMKIPDPTVRERRLAKLDRVENATNFMAKNSNYVNMAVTPLVALIFFLCFYRAGYNYTEHLVVNLYMTGFTSLFYILIITPVLLLARGTTYYLYGIYGFLLGEVIYRTWTYYQFIPRKNRWHLLKVALAALLTVALWTMLSRGVISWYINTGFR